MKRQTQNQKGEIKMLEITKAFNYDDELTMQPGVYEFVEEGINGYPMIKYQEEWYDLFNMDEIKDCVKIAEV